MTQYDVLRNVVPKSGCAAIRRRLNLEIRRVGLGAGDIQRWQTGSFWPSMRAEPIFTGIRDFLDVAPDLWAETQILVRFPDEWNVQQGGPHRDVVPPWAEKTHVYGRIYSVELTPTNPDLGGGTVVFPQGMLRPVKPRVGEGDVLSMSPDLLHAGSPNYSGDVRMALIFRTLVPDA